MQSFPPLPCFCILIRKLSGLLPESVWPEQLSLFVCSKCLRPFTLKSPFIFRSVRLNNRKADFSRGSLKEAHSSQSELCRYWINLASARNPDNSLRSPTPRSEIETFGHKRAFPQWFRPEFTFWGLDPFYLDHFCNLKICLPDSNTNSLQLFQTNKNPLTFLNLPF